MPPWLRSKYQRPRLKVHGAWAFGFCLNIFVMDDPSRHDSSAIIEILAITIEDDPGLEFTCLFWDLEYFEFWPPKKCIYIGGILRVLGYAISNQHQVMRRCDEEGEPRPTVALINESWC